ncbi:MAG: ribonuclease HI family protein [Nitrososphaerota archaeon]
MGGEEACEAYIDGASRGNPGPASYSYVLRIGGKVIKGSGYLGRATNNFAEYQALIHCLRKALRLGCKRLTVYSDSQLLVRQLLGEYRVRDGTLQGLHEEVRKLSKLLPQFEVRHIPREKNLEANNLAQEAIARAAKLKRREMR